MTSSYPTCTNSSLLAVYCACYISLKTDFTFHTWFTVIYQIIYISLMAKCLPLSKLYFTVWPLASRRVQAGRKEFVSICSDLTNLPAVIEQIFRGLCWWTITTLIWSAWAGRSQHQASFCRVRLCVMLRSPPLWTQYPLLLLDRRSIKMSLCFILLKCSDVQKGNCLSLALCCNIYCSLV